MTKTCLMKSAFMLLIISLLSFSAKAQNNTVSGTVLAEDERIFFYMDGYELQVGDIISDGFVIVEINS